MKKSVYLSVFCIFSVFLGACCSISSTNKNDDINTSSDKESLAPADDLQIDLSKIQFWDKESSTYDAGTHILTMKKQWTAGVLYFENFDASSYRYIRIEYEPADDDGLTNQPFRLNCHYDDSTNSEQLCERKRKVQYCELSESRNAVTEIRIWCTTENPMSYKIKSLCFTQNKVLSPVVLDSDSSTFKQLDTSVSAADFVKNLQVGWNLGNTLEAHSFNWQTDFRQLGLENEFHWETTETTPALLAFPHAAGYKTLRIPVTWFNHIIDDNYTIDPDWMARVKTIVDYAIDEGYYVILNEHHSVHGDHTTTYNADSSYKTRQMNVPLQKGNGYVVTTNKADIEESKAFLKAVWTQICAAFNESYDEHLIFETMNEPRNSRTDHAATEKGQTNHEWQPGLKIPWYNSNGSIGGYWCDNFNCAECRAEYEVLNDYNQICLNTIRESGGNNANRFVMIPALCTGVETALPKTEDTEKGIFSPGLFKMPYDSATDRLILTVHHYPSWQDDGIFSARMKNNISDLLDLLNEYYVENGIPVVIGETGSARSIPLEERKKWIVHLVSKASYYGMSVLYWDCGGAGADSYAQIDRENIAFYEKDFVDAMLGAYR